MLRTTTGVAGGGSIVSIRLCGRDEETARSVKLADVPIARIIDIMPLVKDHPVKPVHYPRHLRPRRLRVSFTRRRVTGLEHLPSRFPRLVGIAGRAIIPKAVAYQIYRCVMRIGPPFGS